MNPTLIGCALLSAFLLSFIDLSTSECCHVPLKCTEGSKSVERCYDCSEATVYCGKGKCNVLGCNCDGGCRQGDSTLWCWNIASQCAGKYLYQRLLSVTADNYSADDSSFAANNLFSRIDTDSDGRVSFRETKAYLTRFGPKNVNIKREFNRMDANRDGFLSLYEIDS